MIRGARIPGLDRRQFLQSTVGAVLGSASCPLLAHAKLPMANLDRMSAEQARNLAMERQVGLRLLIPNGSQGNVQPVVSAFEEMTGITIETIITAVDDINTKLMLDHMAASNSYDLALPATFGIPELAEAGVLKDLSELVRRYEPKELRETSLYAIGDSYDGRIYGYQTDGDAYLMFYNKPWLDDADNQRRYADRFGYALGIPETWQELDQQMAFFHEPDKGQFGGALFRTASYVVWEWWIRFHAKGYWPFNDDMSPMIDGEAGVTALEELVTASQSLYPKAPTAGLFENWQAYARGDIYCNIGWGGTQKHLNGPTSRLRGKLAFSNPPGGIVDGEKLVTPYFNWGWDYVVTKQSLEPEIAYLFALFASSPEQSTRSVSDPEGYFDPHRAEHYEDDRIIEAYTEPFLAAHRSCMRSAIPDLYLNGQGEYFGALSEGIMAVLKGRVDAEQALRQASKQWTLTTHRLGRQRQQAQWRTLMTKYPTNIANRLKPRRTAG